MVASPQRNNGGGLTTCAGVAGYCSEGYVGDTCIFVCAFGRPNVPVCESNGQWTDQPRCIEHEPGVEYQISGTCLGIPGYCSLDVTGGLCEFDCLTGPDIKSFCTSDGTWEPYPICDGDIRETRDGCDPCPGPFGGARNRTLESRNQPNQPAGRPNRQNNNNGPIQGFQPVSKSSPTVIQPSRQTPFTPQQPSQPVNYNNNNNRRAPNSRNTNRSSNNNRKANQSRGNNRSLQNNRNRNNQSSRANQFQEQPRKANFQNSQPSKVSRPVSNNNRNNNNNNRSNNHSGASTGLQCPGNSLEVCIDVCPSFSARIFGACVAGCARRCPTKK
eukprot:TCALIF_00752-PA protein Name:"Protein of unknown function" AED:0.06 eAED:0.06 QI:0/0.66/0.75/0.75/0.66/0.5/4/267/328